MRKDVKLGFAIGGVLLAVLIVYVLVISGGDNKPNDVSLVTSDSQTNQTDSAGGSKSSKDDKSAPAGAKKHHNSSGDAQQPPVVAAPAPVPSMPNDDPFKNTASATPSVGGTGTAMATPKEDPVKPPTRDDKWSAALNTGKLP